MRGQVTVFIIVGMFLVIIFGLILYIANSDELSRGDVLIDSIPDEFSPIQNYVHSCMQSVGRDAIEILGERGGYIFTDTYPIQAQLGLQAYPEDPTEGNAFEYLPGTDIIIPYWYYVDSPNHASTLTTASLKPELLSKNDRGTLRLGEKNIEAQIDQYVNTRLGVCLENFRVFTEQGIQVSTPQFPSTTTFITETDVAINVYLPLNVTLQEETQNFENFGVRIPVRLKDAYELAELITQAQADFNVLERNVNNNLAILSGVNSLLPPKDAATFAFGSPGRSWQVEDVKDTITIMLANTQLHQVEGTLNYPRVYTPSADEAIETRQNVYDDMVLPIVDGFSYLESKVDIESIDELNLDASDVKFNYLSWPIYFNVNADGGVIRPDTVGVSMGIIDFGIQRYLTYYDVSWPVAVQIEDTSAFNGEGFIFRFGLEGNIRDNQPVTSGFTQRRTQEFPSVCGSPADPLTIEVFSDECTAQECNPIQGAALTLDISGNNSFISCPLGLTNSQGVLEASIPQGVVNGQIKVSHPDFVFGFLPQIQQAEGYTFYLPQLHEYELEVKKKVATREDGVWKLSQEVSLGEEEQAIVTFKRTKDNEQFYHDEYGTAFILPGSQTQKLAAGSYEVYATLLGPQDSELAASTINEASKYEDPENTLAAFSQTPVRAPIGGVEFDSENPLVLPRELLASGNKITIYVLEFKTDLPPAEIAQITSDYADELVPVIQ